MPNRALETNPDSAVLYLGQRGVDDRAVHPSEVGRLTPPALFRIPKHPEFVLLAPGHTRDPSDNGWPRVRTWSVIPGDQIVWLEHEGRKEPVAIVRSAGDQEHLELAARAWSVENLGLKYSIVPQNEGFAARSAAIRRHDHGDAPEEPEATTVTLAFGQTGEDDWCFHPSEIRQLERRDFVMTREGHDQEPSEDTKRWPVIPGDRIVWADDGESLTPVAIVAVAKRGNLLVLEQVAELWRVERPSRSVVVADSHLVETTENVLAHVFRFVLLDILCALTLGGLFFGWAYMLRRTGYRRRDSLLLFVPLMPAILGTRTVWRFTSKSVYWEPRKDEPSATMFGLGISGSAILGISALLAALLVGGVVATLIANRPSSMSCSDWQAGSQVAGSKAVSEYIAGHPYPPANGRFAIVQNGYWVWDQAQMLSFMEGEIATQGYYTDATGHRLSNPC